MWGWMRTSLLILRFYARHVFRFGEIHPQIPTGQLFAQLCGAPTSTKVALSSGYAETFNSEYAALQRACRRLLPRSNFSEILAGSFAVRVLWCVGAWTLRPWSLALGLAQFLVAPMSLVVCLMRFGTNCSDCLLHYALNAARGARARASP